MHDSARARFGYHIRHHPPRDITDLPDESRAYRATPGPVSGISNAVEVAATFDTALVRLSTGEIYAWGSNGGRALGNGTQNTYGNNSVSVPSQKNPQPVTGITTATKVVAGYNSAYAILSDGTSRAWGDNSNGHLGDNTTTNQSTPIVLNLGQALKGFTSRPTWTTMHFITA